MWGKASWGTSAARWGAAAAVSWRCRSQPQRRPARRRAPPVRRADRRCGDARPCQRDGRLADSERQRGLRGREREHLRGRSSTNRQGHKPRGTGRGCPSGVDLGWSRRDHGTVRLDAASSAMALTARAVTSAPQLSAATASSATDSSQSYKCLQLLNSRVASWSRRGRRRSSGRRSHRHVRRRVRTVSVPQSVSRPNLARGATTTAAQAGLPAAQLETAEADAESAEFIGPIGLTVENAKAAALAVGRATGRSVDSTPVAASMVAAGRGATNAARTDIRAWRHRDGSAGGCRRRHQLASITAATVFAERGGLPVFSVETATAAAVSASRAAALGLSTSAASGAGLFGSTPNQFVD